MSGSVDNVEYDLRDKKFLFYPNLAGSGGDSQLSVTNLVQSGGVSGVCVEKCPDRNDTVQFEGTDVTVVYPSKSTFYRCIDDHYGQCWSTLYWTR